MDYLTEHFELTLIGAGLVLIIAVATASRAWANRDPAHLLRRRAISTDHSIILACAVGVAVLVGIGASAFAARLAQQQIDALRSDGNNVAREEVQNTVFNISLLDYRLAALNRAQERTVAATQLDIASESAQRQFWSDIRFLLDKVGALAGHDAALPPFTASFQTDASAVIAVIRRDLAQAKASPEKSASLKEVTRLEKSRDDIINLEIKALAAKDIDKFQTSQVEIIRQRQRCEIYRLAGQIAESWSDSKTNAPNVADAAKNAEALPKANGEAASATEDAACARPKPRDGAEALALVGAARPLTRSSMSNWLARRAPITLSIELVLVMGALGALLRAVSPLLRRLMRTTAQAPTDKDIGAPKDLYALGLYVVFGMATALAFFILLNVAIGASSLAQQPTVPHGDDLSPFAMAALGLLGGYSSLNVADWMGALTAKIIQPKDSTDRNAQDPPPAPDSARQTPGVG